MRGLNKMCRCAAIVTLPLGLSACGIGLADTAKSRSDAAVVKAASESGTRKDENAAAPPGLQRLRASIDNLDAAIIHLLAERFRVTREVAHLKAEQALPPSDPQREARQVASLRRLASEAGLEPDFAEKFHSFVVAEVVRNHEAVAKSRAAGQ